MPDPSTTRPRVRPWAVALLIAALVLHGLIYTKFMLRRSLGGYEYFLLYMMARVPLTGHSPYEHGVIHYDDPVFRDAAREHYTWWGIHGEVPKGLRLYLGLYYPPQDYLVLTPFSRLPWYPSLAAWATFLTLLTLSCGTLAWAFDPVPSRRGATAGILVGLAFLFNPVTQVVISTGQSVLVVCAAVALGQAALRDGRPWLGALLWSYAAWKPQLGVELVPLALLAGGWRFFARVLVGIAAFNVIGGIVTTGDPLMILQMRKASDVYLASNFNTSAWDGILSWNRLLRVLTGRAIELSGPWIFLGNGLWMAAVCLGALARGGRRWSLTYWVAAAASGAMVFSLTHHFDLVLMVLFVPYLFWLYDNGHTRDLVWLLALMGVAVFPDSALVSPVRSLHVSQGTADVILAYRSVVVIVVAAYLLIRGQPAPRAGTGAGPGV